MNVKVIQTTDDKHLGKTFNIESIEELTNNFGEVFDSVKRKGNIVKTINSNYTVKYKIID